VLSISNLDTRTVNSRTSTTHEIKIAYRKLAMTLHPDRTDGDQKSVEQFKEASEAYDTLSNHSKRTAYDRLHSLGASGRRKPPADYRKVYSPRAPPGFKTFDPKRHFDMHYGDGQMLEEVARAMKRAKEAAGKEEYESPLGPGFSFSSESDTNPYSKRAPQGPRANGVGASIEIDYEESHFSDATNGDVSDAKRVVHYRERVRGRLHERRQIRIERRRSSSSEPDRGCSVM